MHKLYRQRVIQGLLKHLNTGYDRGNRIILEEVSFLIGDVMVSRKYKVSGWTCQEQKPRRKGKRKHMSESVSE